MNNLENKDSNKNFENTSKIFKKKNCSLYIGDLSTKIQENDILNIFSKMSGLESVRICRDVISKKSLGYGYINFKKTKYAKKAMKKMNFYFDKNLFKKPLRIMWKEKNKSLRSSGKGNLFINHLPIYFKTIDLYKLFLPFGKILSCKICFDENGQSKKFGFVHFFSSSDARKAIQELKGSSIRGETFQISPFIKKETRSVLLPKNSTFTNIYIKNLSVDKFTETNIRNMFDVFGEITSIMIPMNIDKPKGFAFINFASHLDAEEAVLKMDGKKVGNLFLYVSKAETKIERQFSLANTWNFIKRGLQYSQNKNFMVIKGINNPYALNLITFLYLSIGKLGKFKVMRSIEKEISLSINISFKKEKKFIFFTKDKNQFVFIKFLNFFQKTLHQNDYLVSRKKECETIIPIKFIIKFSKNSKCFKFINSKNETLISNQLTIRYVKKNQKFDFKKIVYFWLKYKKMNIQIKLFGFFQNLFLRPSKSFIISGKIISRKIEINIEYW
jgi:RNA recognition motif-containing protein